MRTLDEPFRLALKRHDRRAWQDLTSLVQRCAQRAAQKVGASHVAEDVASEVLLLAHTRFIEQLQAGAPLEAFLLEACRRVALAMRRRRGETRIFFDEEQQDEEGEHKALHDDLAEDPAPQIDETIDAARARSRIKASVGAGFWRPKKGPKPKRNQYGCGDHRFAAQLREQRRLRGWTQKQMAAYMGLKLPTYISYEHACVIVPNPDVVSMLRAMQQEARKSQR